MTAANWTPGVGYTGPERECPYEGHVYVIGFVSTTPKRVFSPVKVGMTTDPDGRMYTHKLNGMYSGLRPDLIWVSDPHVDHRGSERQLLRWCREQLGYPLDCWGEVFEGLAPQAVIEHALTIPLVRHGAAMASHGNNHHCAWDAA